ncbi:hypothetical protein BURMUCF2_A1737 [Burkholderia multivorans CF2]|nr:hypothetical protein BURMUCF2_A1737 [Burkholderia multivorans CF2]
MTHDMAFAPTALKVLPSRAALHAKKGATRHARAARRGFQRIFGSL